MAAGHSHSSTLFVTQDGAPMRFYVRPGPHKRQLAPLITHGGGVVCRFQEPGAFLLADSTEGQLGPGYIATAYVTDCVSKNRSLSPRAYRLLPSWGSKSKTDQSGSSTSLLTAVQGASDERKGRPAAELANEEESSLRGNPETFTDMVATTEELTGEREDNMEQMGNLGAEIAHGDEAGLKGRPSVDFANKEEANVQGNRDTRTAMVATTEELTGKREDNMEQMGNLGAEMAHGDEEDLKGRPSVDLANKEEANVQGNRDTRTAMVATTDGLTGERKVNMEQMRNLRAEMTHGNEEELKGRPSVDLTNNKKATIQGNRDTRTAMVATTEEATGEREVSMEQMGNLPAESAHGDEENHKERPSVDLAKKEEVAVQDTRETCTDMVTTTGNRETHTAMVTTAEEATGEREDNMEQMRNSNPEKVHGDKEGHKGNSAVDLTNKEEGAIQGHGETCTSMVSTTEEETGEREDNMEQVGNLSLEKAHGDKEGHKGNSAVDLTNNGGAATRASRQICTSTVTTTEVVTGGREVNLEEGITCPKGASGKEESHATKSTSYGAQKLRPTLKKLDVEQTLNDDKNYITLVTPDPRTSTPAPGIPNTLKELEIDTPQDCALVNDGECHLEEPFRRPKRKVASKWGSGDGEKKRAEKEVDLHKKPGDEALERHIGQALQRSPIGGAQMSELESHGTMDQVEDQTSTEKSYASPAGHKDHIAEAETGTQKCTPKDQDIQDADSQKVQSLQGHMAASAQRKVRTAFTNEEDIAILLYIQSHASPSCTVTGNVLWKDMEKKKVLGRTWQAMKARYGKYLVHNENNYKLPPKCHPLPNKDLRVQGSAKNNGFRLTRSSTSAVTQKCDTTLPSTSSDTPQKRDTTLPRSSSDTPQKRDTTLPSTSADTPQKRDTILTRSSSHTPQKRDAALPRSSSDTPQKRDTTLPSTSSDTPQKRDTTLPRSSSHTPQKRDTTLPRSSSHTPQKRDTTLPSTSSDTPQKPDTSLPRTSTDTPRKCDTTLPRASTDTPQNRDTTLPRASSDTPQKHTLLRSASADTPQKHSTVLPSASTDTPQKHDTTLPSASSDTPQKHSSADVPQKNNTTLPSASANVNQKRGAILPSALDDVPHKCDTSTSAVTPEKHDSVLPSTSTAQKGDPMLPSSSTDTPNKDDPLPPTASAATPQKDDAGLPSASADTHHCCSMTQLGALTSANTLVTHTASKERSILTPRKRSFDPTDVSGSSPQKKGSRMLPSPHSAKKVPPEREDLSDWEDLHIFEIASMEFEEVSDIPIPEQPAAVVRQTEDDDDSRAPPADEPPATSQAAESGSLLEAVVAMTREFNLHASHVTQALYFNSGELGSTRHFLRTGARPDGYPIWEPSDDSDLQRDDPKRQPRLISKYGADNVARRVAFLAS
ncbi:uncharacterized protein ACMZJ9_004048 [Mantella aurantiaca]